MQTCVSLWRGITLTLILSTIVGCSALRGRCLTSETACEDPDHVTAACACGCPDDYQHKPIPCDPCQSANVCCDDYCPKPPPGDPCPHCSTCCDDYCPKPWCFVPCRPIWGATCYKGTITGYCPVER